MGNLNTTQKVLVVGILLCIMIGIINGGTDIMNYMLGLVIIQSFSIYLFKSKSGDDDRWLK